MRKVTFPLMGNYTEAFEFFVRRLGLEPVVPPKTSQRAIKLGVRHSSDMVCFPFKATLGNLIEGLEAGADTIMVIGVRKSENVKETCRFGFYYHIQEQILKRLGYKFESIFICGPTISTYNNLKKANPDLSLPKILKACKDTYLKIEEIEKRDYQFEEKDVNIGLIGEAYTLWEPAVNYDIVRKLKRMDIGVHMSITLSWFLKHQIFPGKVPRELRKEVKKYFPKQIGGHGYESVANSIYYGKNGFDGIIHLLPLSCMPETTVEMVVNMVADDYKIPVYRFPIDENRFDAGFDTRLETFVKLIKRNKDVLRD